MLVHRASGLRSAQTLASSARAVRVRYAVKLRFRPDALHRTSRSPVKASTDAAGTTRQQRSSGFKRPTAETVASLQELVREGIRLTIDTGPEGVTRGFQATRAVLGVGQSYVETLLRGDKPDPPVVVLRVLFEKLGATYIKLGQFIASSPSLFPAEYVTEFHKCLDKTEPVSFDEIKATIAAELDQPIDEVFSHINPVPLASASIAQVHSAELRHSGQHVVLKVLKPGVEAVLRTDLNFLYLAVKFLQTLNPELERASIAGIVEDIRTSMLDEVNFVKEAEHIAQFSEYLDRMSMRAFATCPYVYKQLSSTRLLTLEYIEGVALTDLQGKSWALPGKHRITVQAIRSITTADPETTLINALNTWMGSVMLCETFHADVHAGNLLVMSDGRVAFLDFGIVGRVSPVTWVAVEALAKSVASKDYLTMGKALATMKATDAEVDIDAFARDLEVLFTEMDSLSSRVDVVTSEDRRSAAVNVSVDDSQVNRLLLEMVRVGESHGIRFPREFGLLVKQTLYFDRYVRLLAPKLEVFQDSRVSFGEFKSTSSSPGFR